MNSKTIICIQAKHSLGSWLCINDNLPEVRHLDPDLQALELQGQGTGGCLGKVRLGAGVVTASGLPGTVARENSH